MNRRISIDKDLMRVLLICAVVALLLQKHAVAFHFFGPRMHQKKVTERKPDSGGAVKGKPVVSAQIFNPLQSTVLKPSVSNTQSDRSFQQNMKLGVLFLNLGGPESIEVK